MANTQHLPLPGTQHGLRLVLTVIDERARSDPQSPWVSIPVDQENISKGYKDITAGQLANAVNYAAHWLSRNIPPSEPEDEFQVFAYVGPKDLRYPILAIAAGKLGKVMVLPSPMTTPEAQVKLLENKKCKLYIRPESSASLVNEIVNRIPSIKTVVAPELEDFLQDQQAEPFIYQKSWEINKDDPWLVFHTSGTTRFPKPITYTHRMMATLDVAARLAGEDETHLHHYAFKRWYTPLPMVHFVGMLMVLSMSVFVHTVIVLGPAKPPSPETLISILKFGNVDGALLAPVSIDALCQNSTGLAALRNLQYIHYVGAPLGVTNGMKLASYVRLIPSIGSTEVGGYFLKLREDKQDWDYVAFNSHAGAEFEPRPGGELHELVFVRRHEDAAMQQIFFLYPDLDRFETNDLWMEHPSRKGLWKIVGRTDDYVYLAHGDGLYAATVEKEIEKHGLVQVALVGGHGRLNPILLIDAVDGSNHEDLRQSLLPYLANANSLCHASVHISPELIVFTKPEKPLMRTQKGSVARLPNLKIYQEEIDKLYECNS